MKLAFVLVLVAALAAQSHEANLHANTPPLNSVIKTALVTILEFANKALNSVETYGNNYFLEKLHNYTQIKEWSVNIQNDVTTGVTELLFDLLKAYRFYLGTLFPTDPANKLVNCLAEQEPSILTVVKNATTLNGWCNNRMAPNLTRAFQETTTALLSINAEFKTNADALKKCFLGDDICLTEYAGKVAKLIKAQVSGGSGTLAAAIHDVIGVYKIMFGKDVPACGDKYFFPILADGLRKATNEVVDCTSTAF